MWKQGRGHGRDFGELLKKGRDYGRGCGKLENKWRMQWTDINFWYLYATRQSHSDLQELKHLQTAKPPKSSIFGS